MHGRAFRIHIALVVNFFVDQNQCLVNFSVEQSLSISGGFVCGKRGRAKILSKSKQKKRLSEIGCIRLRTIFARCRQAIFISIILFKALEKGLDSARANL